MRNYIAVGNKITDMSPLDKREPDELFQNNLSIVRKYLQEEILDLFRQNIYENRPLLPDTGLFETLAIVGIYKQFRELSTLADLIFQDDFHKVDPESLKQTINQSPDYSQRLKLRLNYLIEEYLKQAREVEILTQEVKPETIYKHIVGKSPTEPIQQSQYLNSLVWQFQSESDSFQFISRKSLSDDITSLNQKAGKNYVSLQKQSREQAQNTAGCVTTINLPNNQEIYLIVLCPSPDEDIIVHERAHIRYNLLFQAENENPNPAENIKTDEKRYKYISSLIHSWMGHLKDEINANVSESQAIQGVIPLEHQIDFQSRDRLYDYPDEGYIKLDEQEEYKKLFGSIQGFDATYKKAARKWHSDATELVAKFSNFFSFNPTDLSLRIIREHENDQITEHGGNVPAEIDEISGEYPIDFSRSDHMELYSLFAVFPAEHWVRLIDRLRDWAEDWHKMDAERITDLTDVLYRNYESKFNASLGFAFAPKTGWEDLIRKTLKRYPNVCETLSNYGIMFEAIAIDSDERDLIELISTIRTPEFHTYFADATWAGDAFKTFNVYLDLVKNLDKYKKLIEKGYRLKVTLTKKIQEFESDQ